MNKIFLYIPIILFISLFLPRFTYSVNDAKEDNKGGVESFEDFAREKRLGFDQKERDSIHITRQRLIKAIEMGNLENIKKFIHDNGTDLNFTTVQDGTNPFVHASAINKIELVKFFSSEVGVKIDITDAFGNTALMKASEKGHVEIAEYLINNGSDINFQNKEGITPLMVAAEKNNFYVFKMLLDKNADASKSDYTGRTIKEIAENSRDKRILKLLN